MKLLDRYLILTVIESTLLALVVLLGMQTFISFVGELRDLGTKDYGLWQALQFVLMSMPNYLYEFFPIAGLLGCLMGLGRLASNSELMVMRASGVSMTQMVLAVLKAALLMLIVATAIGEWIAPDLENHAENRKTVALSGGQTLSTLQGTWVRDGENFIYIAQVLHGSQLAGVIRYEFANHRLQTISYADSAAFKDHQWIFNHVNVSQLGDNQVTTQYYDQQVWHLSFNPHLLRTASVDPQDQSLTHLYHYMRYLQQTHQASSRVEYVFWKRIFQPLATLIMICIGVPFVFGPLRTVTMGLRVLTGIVIGFGFYMLNEFFGPLTMVYQLPPLLAAATPTILFAVGGGFLLWSAR